MRRTGWVVTLPMLAEAATAGLLVARRPDPITVTGFVLVAVIWLSTAFLQAPAHRRLVNGFDAALHARLVRTNWIRTAAWTARGALALLLLA